MRTMPTIAVAAAVLALAASPASAAQVYAGQPSGASPFQFMLTLSDSGKAVTGLTFHLDVSCGTEFRTVDFGSTIMVDDTPESVQFGRHYLVGAKLKGKRLSGTLLGFDQAGETTYERMSAKLSGTLNANKASGRVAVEFMRWDTSTGEVTAQCATNVSWKALRNPGVVYAGKTSQDEPVVVELTADRKRVSHAHFGWYADCRQGGVWTEAHDEFDLQPFRLSPSGAFSKTYRLSFDGGATVVEQFAGRIGRSKASGTFKGDVTSLAEDDSCSSGRVSWKAATG